MFAIFHKTNNIGKYLWRRVEICYSEYSTGPHSLQSCAISLPLLLLYCNPTSDKTWQANETVRQSSFSLSFNTRASLCLSLWFAVHPWEGNEKQPLFLHPSVIFRFFNHSQMIGCSHISSLESVCNLKFDCDSW